MLKYSKKIIEFTLIYNRYKTGLYNYVLKMIKNRMVTDDIIQNVFLKLFENLSSIKNKNSVRFWLFTTARNEVYTYFRKKKIELNKISSESLEEIGDLSESNLENEFEMMEMKNLIINELNKLTVEQKEIYLLKEYGGLSYKEIAGAMEIDEELVKSKLYRTRQKLINKISKIVEQ
ncbi:MAG: RNA polymerase sigma factor [Melioribacteraceae bacterium]|nr:RNA polymerase sigma factor [Melioribacteraceae bacterium]